MQNIEIKARVPDLDDLLASVRRLGAALTWEKRQRDTFFHAPHGYLKLREVEGEPAELIAYTRASGREPRASDYEIVAAPDGAPLRGVLARSLGVRGVVEKSRALYLFEHTRIHVDTVEGLGTFMELETVADRIPLDAAREEAHRVMAALGVRAEDLVDRPYLVLLEERR